MMSKLCLSSKIGSMSSPKEAELQSPLPGNGANLLSLQETLCGCRPKVLGNLRNECFCIFVNVDQWDNSIQLITFKHQNDKQIDSALKD
jgi:hypothetical protein